jgi:hypothetical protein
MERLKRKVIIRVDRDAVEVHGRRGRRPLTERFDVGDGADRYETLEDALRTARLLRPGRACEIGVQLESARTLYRTVQGEGEHRAEDGAFTVTLPEVVSEVLEPVLARRRVHGRAWFASGPASRAYGTLRQRARVGPIGRGFIVDRSSEAVTVMLVDGATIRWARGAPGDEPTEAAAFLLRRAGEVVNGAYGLHFWHLEDVASPNDEQRRRREANEFEARCHALIGHLPRMASRLP